MTDDLIECYKTCKKLMPFVHLPVQSGSNKILKLMNRKHNVENYIEIYEKLIKINNEIKFSSDFIISYPGETDKDFEQTLDLIKKIKFINSFSFIFSPRPGTKAAELTETDKEKSVEKLKKTQELLFSCQFETNRAFQGQHVEVLIENKMKNQNKLFGRNKYSNPVIFEGDERDVGKLQKIYINDFNQNSLFGKSVKTNRIAF